MSGTRRSALLAVVVLLGAAAFASLPGTAQARTAEDPCALDRDEPQPYRAHRDPPGFTDRGRVCGGLGKVGPGDTVHDPTQWFHADLDANNLPDSVIQQGPPGTRIPGTAYWSSAFSYNWDWDYYVAGGEWLVWNGGVPYVWPKDGVLPGGEPGYSSIVVTIRNWIDVETDDPFWSYDLRVFWNCEPAGGSARAVALAPPAGDGGDDTLSGGTGSNALIGLAGDDRLYGRAGDDHLHGGAGNDALFGGVHHDLIHGRRHSDKAVGGNGSDDILTGKGRDIARGGPDGDQLFDDEGRDILRGGGGNDRFSARDGDRDVIRCGAGEDIAIIDSRDVAIECEHAYRSALETPAAFPEI